MDFCLLGRKKVAIVERWLLVGFLDCIVQNL